MASDVVKQLVKTAMEALHHDGVDGTVEVEWEKRLLSTRFEAILASGAYLGDDRDFTSVEVPIPQPVMDWRDLSSKVLLVGLVPYRVAEASVRLTLDEAPECVVLKLESVEDKLDRAAIGV